MPTRKISRAFRRPTAAGSLQAGRISEYASLVDFLEVVQETGVSLLPISSYKSLGILGRGFSGVVQQSIADVATTLAFKEGVPSKLQQDTSKDQDWRSLVTEISILQHAPIRTNPHIIDLLGVSLYVEPSTKGNRRALPLLITSKVNRGDLGNTLHNGKEGILTENQRMRLFAMVTESVQMLHACGIAHGDIKPENFLIDESKQGEIKCLLTDFGSSVIRGQKCFPTMSEPWNAPELENVHQVLGFDEVVQSDIFSFGLVCIHLLLPLEELENASLCLLRRPGSLDNEWNQFINQMKGIKRGDSGGSLATLVLDLIGNSKRSPEGKEILRKIVTTTISPQSGKRTIPWTYIEQYLSQSFDIKTISPTNPVPLAYSASSLDHSKHVIFNLANALPGLDDTDYVFRANIAQDLANKANNSFCTDCRRFHAFNLAICHTIGFGCYENRESAKQWLERSEKSLEHLDSSIKRIGAAYKVTNEVEKNVLDATGIGFILSANRTEEYQTSRRLPEACKSLRDEIQARTAVFGDHHCSLAKLRSELSLVLKAQNRLGEAQTCQQETVNILEQNVGQRHPVYLLAKVELAGIFADQGRLIKAVDLQKEVQPVLVQVLGANNPETITGLQRLGTFLTWMGDFRASAEVFRNVVSLRNEVLSPRHPMTVRAELSLAYSLAAQGLLKQTSDLVETIDEKLSNLLTSDHLTRAIFCISKAILFHQLNSNERATKEAMEALAAVDKLMLPRDDILRLRALETMALIHGGCQQWDEQETVLRQMLDAQSSPDQNNRGRSGIKAFLANNLLSQTRLEEASAVAHEVIDASEDALAMDPIYFIDCVNISATVLSFQGQMEEAEKERQNLLESCMAKFGDDDAPTLDAMCALGEFFSDKGEFDKAQHHYQKALGYLRNVHQPGKNAIGTAKSLAVALREQSKYEEAMIQCKEAIVWASNALGEEHSDTLAVYNVLLRTYTLMGRYSDAETLYLERLKENIQDTKIEIYVKQNMVLLRRKQERLEEAAELNEEVHRLGELVYDKLHPDRIKLEGDILNDQLVKAETITDELENAVLRNISLKRDILGTRNRSTIMTMIDLAYAYGGHGRFEDSVKLFKDILDLGDLEALLNPELYAQLLGKLGEVYFRMGRLQDAENTDRECLAIRQRIFSDRHRSVLQSMSNLASTLQAQKKYSEAEEYCRRVITAYEDMPMTNLGWSFKLLKSRIGLAAVLFFQGKLPESLAIYSDTIESAENIGLPNEIINAWKEDQELVLLEITNQGIAG